MFIDMAGGKPIKCSKCGSINASRPLNNRDVEIRCDDCGHSKLTAEAERRRFEEDHPELARRDWQYGVDAKRQDPTF